MATEKAAQEEGPAQMRFVTLTEVKELLEREQGSRGPDNMTYEQKLALDHAGHFAKLAPETVRDLVEKLAAVGGRVNEYYAYRIADLLPTHEDDVRAIFARDRSAPDAQEIEKILAVVREYV